MRSCTLQSPSWANAPPSGTAGTHVPSSPPGGRPGFSLVELCVGVLLLEVGVLALAATAGGIVRMTVLGGREGASSLVAASRLEELRASACSTAAGPAAVTGGADTTGPFAERWSLAADGPVRAVEVAVSYSDGRRTRSARYVTAISCER